MRTGQNDDMQTPAMRILFDEDVPGEESEKMWRRSGFHQTYIISQNIVTTYIYTVKPFYFHSYAIRKIQLRQ